MLEPSRQSGRHYEILRVVNRGGMGEIALGRVTGVKGFEKLVILKRLRADAEREDHVAMFDVEQEVMSRLEHPNVVKVFDQPVVDHVPYLAMEYVRGRNLDQIIRATSQLSRPIAIEFGLSVISEVLRGLAFVHRLKDSEGRAMGVVHQDMTPSNVMVSFFGEVKITDFGISYVTSRDGGLRKGVLKGKPRYVAPEVLAGKRVNNTADIYGVGVVLFEMLTGKALFARATVKDTLSAVAKNELPDFNEKLGHLGEGVVRILERATKKDPTERYRTAEAMAADVLNELAKRGGPVPAATLGYQVRQLFNDDPDVPEIDPAFEEAIVNSPSAANKGMQPADLKQTLEELDRLLGKSDGSVDLFDVPAEIQNELTDMPDLEPFSAKTPIPDFVWDAKDDAEILERAEIAYRAQPIPLFPPPPDIMKIPGDDEMVGAPRDSAAPPPFLFDSAAPATAPPARLPPPARAPSSPEGPAADFLPPDRTVAPRSPSMSPEVPREQSQAAHGYRTAPKSPSQAIESPAVIRVPEPAQTSGQFWMGLLIGLAVGVAVGYLLM